MRQLKRSFVNGLRQAVTYDRYNHYYYREREIQIIIIITVIEIRVKSEQFETVKPESHQTITWLACLPFERAAKRETCMRH